LFVKNAIGARAGDQCGIGAEQAVDVPVNICEEIIIKGAPLAGIYIQFVDAHTGGRRIQIPFPHGQFIYGVQAQAIIYRYPSGSLIAAGKHTRGIGADIYFIIIFRCRPDTAEAWEDENLNKIDLGLKRTFDLQERFRDIREGLEIIKENLELFKDLLQYRNSTLLEWIVIILVFLEVLDLLIDKIFK